MENNRMEFKKILVPVTGQPIDEDVIRLACRLVNTDKGKGKSKIWAVYVITVKRSLPLNAEIESETRKAEDILNKIEIIAEDAGCEIDTDLLQSRDAAPTIVDEAVERDVDLIILGIAYKRRFGQFSLGSVAPYVMEKAPCQVMLFHGQSA